MTAKAVDHAVIGHGDIAVFTADRLTAVPAGNKGRMAAAIDKQNRLLSAFNTAGQSVQHRAGKDRLISAAEFFSHINDVHPGKRATFYALRHFKKGIISTIAHRKGQHAGGCAGQKQHTSGGFAALAPDVSCIILRISVREIAVFVLFIDDDESNVFKWGKDRRAGTDDNMDLAPADFPPFVKPLSA